MASSSCSTSLCSSVKAHCKLSDGHYFPPLSLSSRSIFSSPSSSLKLGSRRLPFLGSPKSSDSAADVIEADFEPATIFEASDAAVDAYAPKREEFFAAVMIILNKVLLVGTRTSTYIGYPVVQNASVHAVVEEQGLDDKVNVFKYKNKKKYRRNIGHRQLNTRIRITGITGYEDSPSVTLDCLKNP